MAKLVTKPYIPTALLVNTGSYLGTLHRSLIQAVIRKNGLMDMEVAIINLLYIYLLPCLYLNSLYLPNSVYGPSFHEGFSTPVV